MKLPKDKLLGAKISLKLVENIFVSNIDSNEHKIEDNNIKSSNPIVVLVIIFLVFNVPKLLVLFAFIKKTKG